MTTITIKVTPEQKALHLAVKLGIVNSLMKGLRKEFPSRSECSNKDDDGRVCRGRLGIEPDDLCERCRLTEELSIEWADLRQQRYALVEKLSKLGLENKGSAVGVLEAMSKRSKRTTENIPSTDTGISNPPECDPDTSRYCLDGDVAF